MSANVSPTPSRNIAASTTAMFTSSGDDGADQDGDDDHAAQVGDCDQPAAVDPVGDDPGEQAEEEEREVLQDRGERDQERVTRLRGDEERTGRDLEAVGDVADPARAEQPAERGAQPSRHHRLDQGSVHNRSMLAEAP